MLSVYAGQIGGYGTLLEGLSPLSRLSSPTALAWDGTDSFFVATGDGIVELELGTGQLEQLYLEGDEATAVAFDGASLYASSGATPFANLGAYTFQGDFLEESFCIGSGESFITGLVCAEADAGYFNQPAGLAYTGPIGTGQLYVADLGGDAIYVVDVQAETASLVAGLPGTPGSADGVGMAARFRSPNGLALDGDGGLYVTDQENYTLRWIDLDAGQVTTLAGAAGQYGSTDGLGGAARFSYLGGVAVGGGQVFIADQGNDEVRQYSPATGQVTTVAGRAGFAGSTDATGVAARFDAPQGVLADGQGHVYVADQANDTVRQITTAGGGVVTTLLGLAPHAGEVDGAALGGAEFDGPVGLCTDGTTLYLIDSYGNTVREIDPVTLQVTTLAGGSYGTADGVGVSAQFDNPTDCVCDQAGNLYVADTDNETIRKIVIATAKVSTLAGLAGTEGFQDGTGNMALFEYPRGLALDSNGSLYVADLYNCAIRQIDPTTGKVTTFAGPGAPACEDSDGTGIGASFSYPGGLYDDGQGNLYVAEESGALREIVLSTIQTTTIPGNIFDAIAVSSDGMGGLYVLSGGLLEDVSLPSGSTNLVLGSFGNGTGVVPGPLGMANLNYPQDLLFVPGLGLLITDENENAVLLVH